MSLKVGQIVKNLVPTEPVQITKVEDFEGIYSITYVGVNSKVERALVISEDRVKQLEIVGTSGSFNFEGDPNKFKIFAEAERIHSAFQFDPLFAVNCSIVDPLPHQVEAVYRNLLPLPKIRFLLADDTGAGKTIMTGLLVKELLMRGMIERVLIVTPGGLTRQWQEDEMAVKFNLPFRLVNRSIYTSDPNIFHSADRIVTSIDFVAQKDVLGVVANSHWDLVVVDEAHKLSAYEYGQKKYLSQRYMVAQALSQQCEHMLLLTATPHRGRKDTFKMLLQLLDEDIFATDDLAAARVQEIEQGGVNKFFIRRLKEDMKDWDGAPLYKARHTKTVAYELSHEEKELYDAVTDYLTRRKEEAAESKNIHVSLALTVMQRRLVSSIRAIKNTLFKRWKALDSIIEEVAPNPALWSQKVKIEGFDVYNIEDFEEFDDDDREAIESLLSDPKKFRLFTTASNPEEIKAEAKEVKRLFDMADELEKQQKEEEKFRQLNDLLRKQGVLENGEKLVIFTEHKDTLLYLEERLTKRYGYKVAVIHGSKSVDERRKAQADFAKPDTQILIGTDAAGEGINLQFCRLLINWDIPWNPNRLEQRMGRVHRYGQKQDVLVFNMVASNTREGQVLNRLLSKLDIIRESLGDDRVYDVIQDVLENVRMDDVINSIFNGKQTEFDAFLAQDGKQIEAKFQEKIRELKEKLGHSTVNYLDARRLKAHSDEKRLQPIYIKLFFENAFRSLGGVYEEKREFIYAVKTLPESMAAYLKREHNIQADAIRQLHFCFDKQVFLDYQNVGDLGKIYYINPGNLIFDALVAVIRDSYREHMLQGTILVSPDDKEPYFAFFVKSQIADNRPHKSADSVADERLILALKGTHEGFQITSPAKFIDLHAPVEFAKLTTPPEHHGNSEVKSWCLKQVTLPQLETTKEKVDADTKRRLEYLENAFARIIIDLQIEIQEQQGKLMLGDQRAIEKIQKRQDRLNALVQKKATRLEQLRLMAELSARPPEVLGCAYVIPLTQVEYLQYYGMSRDDEVEAIAMQVAMEYERSQGWVPTDVSANNEGYDIRSISSEDFKRYIEVKGRSAGDGSVMLSENEYNRLYQLGEAAWLYIVMHCKANPQLHRIQNPAKSLKFEQRTKGVQFFLPMAEWKSKI